MSVQVAVKSEDDIGENPLWNPYEDRLYWCDLPDGELYRYNLRTEEHTRIYDTDFIGGFVIHSDRSLLIFEGNSRITLWKEGDVRRTMDIDLPAERNDYIFNEACADPEGRVLFGVRYADERFGSLYRLGRDGDVVRIIETVENPNGLGFSPGCSTLYVTETGPTHPRILAYDYDRENGEIHNRTVFKRFEDAETHGLPDGLAVDQDGTIYSARAHGGMISRFKKDGTPIGEITVPVRYVTSIAFGGTESETIFVTTGGGTEKETYGKLAGSLFVGEIDAKGVDDNISRFEFPD
jgi:D-xylonolactonase